MPHPEVISLGSSVPWTALLSGTSVLQELIQCFRRSGASARGRQLKCSGSEQLRRTQHGEATTAIGTGEDGITAWH